MDQHQHKNMQTAQYGNTNTEKRLVGFVMDKPHAHQAAYRAAQKSDKQQDSFGNAPHIFNSPLLIKKHKYEAKRID